VQNFSAANWSNVCPVEREQRDRSSFGSHKLDLEGRTIFIAMYHCPYITLYQPILVNVMC